MELKKKMSKQLEMCLDMVGANYRGCHNCKYYKPDVSFEEKDAVCKECIPINWKGTVINGDWRGCHNCKHFDSDIGWSSRGNECKVCIMSNWESNEYTQQK